jgi:hypothetical protein
MIRDDKRNQPFPKAWQHGTVALVTGGIIASRFSRAVCAAGRGCMPSFEEVDDDDDDVAAPASGTHDFAPPNKIIRNQKNNREFVKKPEPTLPSFP